MAELNPKQERFCSEYLIDFNGTQAAIRSGYSKKTAGSQAFDLLKKPEIQQQIQRLSLKVLKKLEITKERVMEEIAALAFSKITDYLEVKKETRESYSFIGFGDDDDDDDRDTTPETYQVVEIKETAEMDPAAIPAIASIKQGKSGIELKLHDKAKALEMLAQHFGIYNAAPPPANVTFLIGYGKEE